jgi:hypothetical protein
MFLLDKGRKILYLLEHIYFARMRNYVGTCLNFKRCGVYNSSSTNISNQDFKIKREFKSNAFSRNTAYSFNVTRVQIVQYYSKAGLYS